MTTQQNVELEAAKFLHKLIQESKDEPAKLATKLYVILQHMKSSGKENSMPYQVISRAMETVINQHGLDIEALKSSRLPIPGGSHAGDSSTSQLGGSSQAAGVAKDSKAGLAENEGPKIEQFASTRPPIGPNSSGHDYFQAPGSHRGSQSFDHESPSSLDSRSTNSQSQERRETGKKTTSKRKRGDTSVPTEPNNDNPQQLDSRNTVVNPRKGKMNKFESSGFSVKGGEQANINMLPSGQMEQFQSLTSSMRPVMRTKQEGPQLVENQLDSTNINHLMSRALNSKYPEETEVSSDHNPLSQQQIPSAHDIVGAWNQNKTGLPFEKSQVPRFSPNVVSGNAEIPMQTPTPSIGTSTFGKVHGGAPVASSSIPPIEPGFSSPMQFGGTMLSARKVLEQDGGSSNMLADASKLAQAGSMLKSTAPRDTGKSPVIPPVGPGLPFGEHQLKQLRAQCLVFLAFRNGLMPKKLHLEIALGNIFPKEGGSNDGSRKELVEHKGKVQSSSEPNNVPEAMMPSGRVNSAGESGTLSTGRLQDTDSLSKEAGNLKMVEDKNGPPSDHSIFAEERKHLLASRKSDVEMQTQETMASQQHHDSSGTRSSFAVRSPGDKLENGQMQVGRANQVALNKQMNPDMAGWTGAGNHDLVSRGLVPASAVQHGLASERKDSVSSQFQNLINAGSGIQQADASLPSFSLRDRWKPVSGIDNNHHVLPVNDTNLMPKHVSREQVEDDNSGPSALPPSPRYTMSEKLIFDLQKKKQVDQRSWVLKRQKAKQKIATSFHKLKENVSSSEDISTKTKSVIELKKLQLLELQRRLRSDFLNEFFKPVNTEVDRLRALKKHKHGRRVKQLERFEQKMKEERQKRIRERQKEFFGEIEVHKERLEDIFKFRRERWKGFNKYVKEFHKRKERIHREKIDRIQREKINLLKINDVEGYLRMVQDAKSDRVKQLLKETEKYLQKLGSKLQEAKAISSQFEHDMDETGTTSIVEKSEAIIDNEDESDQAKHYLESNEKYYLMAHSIKESIAEQPASLQCGKLREYQMNGLRWLVSLYNNHLNGILADEMGLGKTVQVIALICYLMETKNDRGPFLVVVPSSVLPGWESEISFWAPSIHKIVYSGPPEERRKLFKERIVHQKFNVLLTTYEYLMNKHDRPKLSKIQWHYVIIDEGHRIKNASCKLNADLKHYQSSHRLLLTGTPLQNNLDELWALLNFLLPNIFNSSEDFSQWFNKPFQSNGDNSADEALLSEEENLLIINRLHQVLRPFVLRRLKHKVENQLPEKIERLIRCEASAYQKLLMKRVEDNLGSINNSRARSVHNSVMELRNICNHPYLSQLHADEVDTLIPKHYLPPIIRLCGKLEMLDRILPKLKATDHRVLFFSTMTRLLDVMEEYLNLKQYRYLRLDGHTSGGDRGALIDMFNKPDSPFFIFLLSIRAGGVGVNLQAADTVIIFDTDWNPQVDLQAQARAHRIGQKREVLVLRFETVQTVEEQVRASAEHKLGVANQSITAGFFDNNTSAEDRREYLESLLRESKKEEAAPVLDDDSLNDVLARSESEIDVFESIDKQRRDTEMATWRKLALAHGSIGSDDLPPLPSRLVTEDDLKEFYEAMKIYEVPKTEVVSNVGMKRKGGQLGGLDTQHYGRGKRAREVRCYEEQWTEEEFEKMCQVDGPDSPSKPKEEVTDKILPTDGSHAMVADVKKENPAPPAPNPAPPTPNPAPPTPAPALPPPSNVLPVQQPVQMQQSKEVMPPPKRGRGRPKRTTTEQLAGAVVPPPPSGTGKGDVELVGGTLSSSVTISRPDALPGGTSGTQHHVVAGTALNSQPAAPPSVTAVSQTSTLGPSVPTAVRGQGQKTPGGTETPRRRGKKRATTLPAAVDIASPDPKHTELARDKSVNPSVNEAIVMTETASSVPAAQVPVSVPGSSVLQGTDIMGHPPGVGTALNPPPNPLQVVTPVSQTSSPSISMPLPPKGQGRKNQSGVGAPRRRGKKQTALPVSAPDASAVEELKSTSLAENKSGDLAEAKSLTTKQDSVQEPTNVKQERACHAPGGVSGSDVKSTNLLVNLAQGKPTEVLSTRHDSAEGSRDAVLVESQSAAVVKDSVPESASLQPKISDLLEKETVVAPSVKDKMHPPMSTTDNVAPVLIPSTEHSTMAEGVGKEKHHDVAGNVAMDPQSNPAHSFVLPSSSSTLPCPSDSLQVKRPGRKAQNRAETPRRRGRRQVPIVSPIPDAPAFQDLKSSSQSVDISAVLSGKPGIDSQQVTNLTQAQTKQPTNLSATIDGSAGSSERIPAIGRIQTADVNDVARVMKEVFSVPSKTAESSRKEGKVAVPLPSNPVMEVTKNQTSEDKGSSPMATLGTAPPGFDLSVKSEKQSGKGGDANASLLDKTQAKAERKIVMGLIGKFEGSSQSKEGATSTSNMKTTQEITGATVNKLSSSLASPTAMEVVVGSNSAGKETEPKSKETPQSCFDVSDMAADHSGATPTIAVSKIPADVVPDGMADGGSGDTMEPSVDDLKTISPQDSGSHEGPHISQKDDVGDRPNVTEIISANETEPALEELPKPSIDIPSLENPTTVSVALNPSVTANYREGDPEKINLPSMEAEAVKCTDVHGDNSNVAAPVSQSLDHSNVMEAPCMTMIDPENETEPPLKDLSSFDISLENLITSPVSVGQSGTVTGEVDSDKYSLSSMEAVTDAAVVEVPEVSLEAVADKKQAPEDKGSSPVATLETAAPGFHLPVKSEKQSRNGSDANASVPDGRHAKVERKIVVGLIAKVESSSQYKQDATCTSNMETTREINDNPLIQPPDAGPSDCVTGATVNEVSSSLASPTAMEIVGTSNSGRRETEPESNESQQAPRFDVSDRVAGHSGATPTIAVSENPADVVPDGMAGGSGNTMEPSADDHPSVDDHKTIYPHDSGSHEGSKISEKDDVGDPNVTSPISQTVDHSSVMEVSNMAENNTEPALEELPKPSIDISSLENPITGPVTHDPSGTASFKVGDPEKDNLPSMEVEAVKCTDDVGDPRILTSPVSQTVDHSSAMEVSNMTKLNSTNETEHGLEESPKPSFDTSLENPTTGLVNLDPSSAANFREGDPEKVNLPMEAEAVKGIDDVGDHPNATSPVTQSLDHSSVMEAPRMSEIEGEPALKDSTNSSFDIRRVENATTSPITVCQSGTVTGEVDNSKYIAGSSGEHPVGRFVGMDETKGSANIVADDMDVEETVAQPTSPSVELMIEGLSEKGRLGCLVAQGFLEMSKAEVSDQMDTSEESLPTLQKAGENVDTSVPLTESNTNDVEMGQLVSREVDLASSVTPEEMETEKSSEKNQISSALGVVEMKGPEAEVSQQVDLSQVSMLLPKIVMSENDEKEIEGSSEKNQIAVVVMKGTEAEVGQQVDESQVSKALPEIVMSENNDPPASSIVAEQKKSEDVLSSSLVVLEGSLKSMTEIDNRVEDSIVSEITSQNVDSLVTPGESKLKTGVASQVCDNVSECGNEDLSPCPPAQKGDNVQSLIGNSVIAEESESKVGAASLVGNTVPECENTSSSPAQELESKDGIASQVCDAVPAPEVDKVPALHEMELDGSLLALEESKPTDGAASQTMAESENKECPPIQEGDNVAGSHEMVVGDLVAPEVSGSKDEVASPVCDTVLESKDLPPRSPALEVDNFGSNEMKLVGSLVEPEKLESVALEGDKVEGSNERELVGSLVEPEKPESASQVCDRVPECGENDLLPCTSLAQAGDDVAGSHETGTVGCLVAPEESLVGDTAPNCENKDLPPCSPAQESVNVAVSNEMEIIGSSVEPDESEPKVSSLVCDTMPDSKNKDSPPCSSAQEVEDVKDSLEAEAKEAALGSSAKPEETRG